MRMPREQHTSHTGRRSLAARYYYLRAFSAGRQWLLIFGHMPREPHFGRCPALVAASAAIFAAGYDIMFIHDGMQERGDGRPASPAAMRH